LWLKVTTLLLAVALGFSIVLIGQSSHKQRQLREEKTEADRQRQQAQRRLVALYTEQGRGNCWRGMAWRLQSISARPITRREQPHAPLSVSEALLSFEVLRLTLLARRAQCGQRPSARTARAWSQCTRGPCRCGRAVGLRLATLTAIPIGYTRQRSGRDGTRVVTTSEDKTAQVWEAQSASAHHLTVIGPGYAAAFSADAHAGDGDADGTAQVWDVQQARPWSPWRRVYSAVQMVLQPGRHPPGHGARHVHERIVEVWEAQTGLASRS